MYFSSELPKSVQTRHHFLTNLVKEDLLMVLKLCVDWLRVNPEVTQCEDAIAMFTQLVNLLNILPKQDELWRIGELANMDILFKKFGATVKINGKEINTATILFFIFSEI